MSFSKEALHTDLERTGFTIQTRFHVTCSISVCFCCFHFCCMSVLLANLCPTYLTILNSSDNPFHRELLCSFSDSSMKPAEIPWGDAGAKYVVESTGVFLSVDKANVCTHIHTYRNRFTGCQVVWFLTCALFLSANHRLTSRVEHSVWLCPPPHPMLQCLSWELMRRNMTRPP